MRKIIVLLLSCIALCSCSDSQAKEKKEMLTYKITVENYSNFFNVNPYDAMYKVTVSPCFNKHLIYDNVVFNFKTTYSEPTGAGQSKEGTYDFSITLDETGNGQGVRYKGGSATSTRVELVSVSGSASFKEDYTFFEQIDKVKRDSYHKEDIGVYYSLTSGSRYVLRFKSDLNFDNTPNTDAFYLIKSVNVKFTATVNNVSKSFEYNMHPNFCGVAEIPVEDNYNNISNFSFKYINGYYLTY